MIGSLRGMLLERVGGEVLVEVAGLGYRITVSPATSIMLGELGDDVFVHIHHHIRDDAQTLYGFPTAEERRTFEALIGAHGVGPALGLAILSVHEPLALQRILTDDDVAALCLVPGVGKKTAARLLVELKSRLEVHDVGGDAISLVADTTPSAVGDVQHALSGLGYGVEEIREALRELPGENDPARLLKQALQKLAAGS